MNFEKHVMLENEDMYTFSQSSQISGQTGLIGHLRADFGKKGNEFWSSWFDYREDLKTDAFREEFQTVINALREDGGILHNLKSIKKYCNENPQSKMRIDPDMEYHGIRIDTEKYAYFLRLCPLPNNYNVYVYCYSREWINYHLKEASQGIRFIDSGYNELFRIPDGGRIKIRTSWGKENIYTCRFVDQYHLEVGTSLYHSCEFAERMEKNGASYEPLESNHQNNHLKLPVQQTSTKFPSCGKYMRKCTERYGDVSDIDEAIQLTYNTSIRG